MSEELAELEARVSAKWLTACGDRAGPEVFDPSSWAGSDWDSSNWKLVTEAGLWAGVPQFPREQWAALPNRRRVALMLCDRALDLELTDKLWVQVCLIMQYGGKTRLV